MTSQRSPYDRFQRAVKPARSSTPKQPPASSADSTSETLRLVELYAAYEPDKFEPAAVRWYTRYLNQADPTLLQAGIALAAPGELRGRGESAGKLLAKLCR